MFDSNDNYLEDNNKNLIQKLDFDKSNRFLSIDNKYNEIFNDYHTFRNLKVKDNAKSNKILDLDCKCQCKVTNNNDNNDNNDDENYSPINEVDNIDYEYLWPHVKYQENCSADRIFSVIGVVEGMYKLQTGKYL